MKDTISNILITHPEGLSIADIAKKADISRHTVAVILAELRGEDKIKIRKVAAAKLHYWK